MPVRQRCAICRKAALPGARLCGPCRAALKRARDTTVSEAWIAGRGPRATRPLRPRPEPAGRPLRDDAAVAAPTGPAPASAVVASPEAASPARRPWAIAAAVVGTLAGAAIAVAHLRPGPGVVPAPRYAVAEGAPSTEPVQASGLLPASLPVAAVARPGAAAADAPAAPRPVEVEVPPQALDGRAKVRQPVRAAPPPMEPPPVPEVAPVPPVAVVADVAPPPPVVALATEAPMRPPPDRWQRLADALERCPDDFIARTVCQQSLRLEHCEGAWGRAPACPARVERDYGN